MTSIPDTEHAQHINPAHAWFQQARFGLFIHWGVYAVPATNEWMIFRDGVPKQDYAKFAERFAGDRFDAEEWVAQAVTAGAKYLIVTAKHHDGFCLYDTATTDWKSTRTPFGQDAVAALAQACRAAGLRFGIYFSIWDLWHPGLDGGLGEVDAEGNLLHHGGENGAWTPTPEGVSYMHEQLRELLTQYGRIDLLWFDVRRASAEAYRGGELMAMIRELQPDILVNDRLVKGQDYDDPRLKPDLITPENRIPPEGLRDEQGRELLWESCMCLNEHWGYSRDDRDYKSTRDVLCQLAEVTSKGGNLLLNIGPNARGEFPRPFYPDILNGVGRWLERNGQAIWGTTPCRIRSEGKPFLPWFTDVFKWKVVYTQADHILYAHILRRSADLKFIVPSLDGYVVKHATLVDDGSDLPLTHGSYMSRNPAEVTVNLPRHSDADHELTTVALELELQ